MRGRSLVPVAALCFVLAACQPADTAPQYDEFEQDLAKVERELNVDMAISEQSSLGCTTDTYYVGHVESDTALTPEGWEPVNVGLAHHRHRDGDELEIFAYVDGRLLYSQGACALHVIEAYVFPLEDDLTVVQVDQVLTIEGWSIQIDEIGIGPTHIEFTPALERIGSPAGSQEIPMWSIACDGEAGRETATSSVPDRYSRRNGPSIQTQTRFRSRQMAMDPYNGCDGPRSLTVRVGDTITSITQL